MNIDSDPRAASDRTVAGSVSHLRVVSDLEAAELAAEIPIGSPFAPGTALPLEWVGQTISFEAGVWRETMLGGLLASLIMIVFGLGSLATFPIGSTIIASGGCLLGAMALATRRPTLAMAATMGNLIVLAIGLMRAFA
ncbi:hypothetical protein Poly24_37780 [Rosistilla carotiformis]|uniref:Uncharacterized protein n=1 Tax=Rosistilla carotiformis TaxID=2528017 RepID=A0A518JWZ6_9BACT|nr:hypothetical protein [Rosistilla carotiformis]QDV70059.1 hypothetical protein Poly24_37780 [Rosistilla carotiformis]